MALQEYYSASELARLSGVTRQMVNYDILKGRVRAVKFNGDYVIKKEDGNNYIKMREEKNATTRAKRG